MIELTFSKLVIGFEPWFFSNLKLIQELFTPEMKEEFETIEDYALELFLEIKCGE